MPSHEPLSKPDILRVTTLLRGVFEHIRHVREQDPLGHLIQYPKIPPKFSESIVCHLIRDGVILSDMGYSSIRLGGTTADLIGSCGAGGDQKIEVKATGLSAFQEFGPKDITCDVLVWLYFGDAFAGNDRLTLELFIIRKPARFFPTPVKITLVALRSQLGSDVEHVRKELSEVWFSQA